MSAVWHVFGEKARFLATYNYLLTSNDTLLNKFYAVAQKKANYCAKYKDIWEEIYKQA